MDYYHFVEACGELGALKATGKLTTAFISIEPLLSWDSTPDFTLPWLMHGGIDWLIIGQQTPVSKKTEPRIEWVNEIEAACRKAGIPYFEKDNLKTLLNRPLVREFPRERSKDEKH